MADEEEMRARYVWRKGFRAVTFRIRDYRVVLSIRKMHNFGTQG